MKDHPVIDTPYIWDYFRDQSPVRINYVARFKGVNTKPHTDPFSYLELGCGNGVTANALAASFPKGEFVAVDMNPEHIDNAARLADKGGLSNIRFINKRFEEIFNEDLPSFDYITLHGVYSWVSAEVRRDIRDIVDKFLAPSGLVYVSYNSLPGWAPLLPLREIMLRHTAHMEEGTLAKVAEGLNFLKFFRDNNSTYFKTNPIAGRMLDKWMQKDPHYIAHEFFNESWHPQYFSEVDAEMGAIDLRFIGSTALDKNLSDSLVPADLRPRLEDTEDAIERETLRSFIFNEAFRRDVYRKDTAPTAQAGSKSLFSDWIFGTIGFAKLPPDDDCGGKQEGKLDHVREHANGMRTVAEINLLPALKPLGEDEIIGCIHELVAAGRLRPFAIPMRQLDGVLPDNFKFSIVRDFNRTFLRERLFKHSPCYLASEVAGDCIRIKTLHGLLLLAGEEVGLSKAPLRVLEFIEKTGKTWRQNGKELNDPAERRRVLQEEHQAFCNSVVPWLLGAGIIEPSV